MGGFNGYLVFLTTCILYGITILIILYYTYALINFERTQVFKEW